MSWLQQWELSCWWSLEEGCSNCHVVVQFLLQTWQGFWARSSNSTTYEILGNFFQLWFLKVSDITSLTISNTSIENKNLGNLSLFRGIWVCFRIKVINFRWKRTIMDQMDQTQKCSNSSNWEIIAFNMDYFQPFDFISDMCPSSG